MSDQQVSLNLLLPKPEDFDVSTCLYYLLLFRPFFVVYFLSREGNRESGHKLNPDYIPVQGGWTIADCGHYLITSPGEYYGPYAIGRGLKTVEEMARISDTRGVKAVEFRGPLPMQRKAYLEFTKRDIKNNYASEYLPNHLRKLTISRSG